jgi:hypothetical protein
MSSKSTSDLMMSSRTKPSFTTATEKSSNSTGFLTKAYAPSLLHVEGYAIALDVIGTPRTKEVEPIATTTSGLER